MMAAAPSLTLNWRELELLFAELRPEIEGYFVDRIIVPERTEFPGGYLKGEWAIRMTSRKNERVLLMSIRPRHPYIALCDGKGPRAAASATRSPFDQAVAKHRRGPRLARAEAIPRERT